MCICFKCLWICFFPFSVTYESQLSHADLLSSFPNFLPLGLPNFCALWKTGSTETHTPQKFQSPLNFYPITLSSPLFSFKTCLCLESRWQVHTRRSTGCCTGRPQTAEHMPRDYLVERRSHSTFLASSPFIPITWNSSYWLSLKAFYSTQTLNCLPCRKKRSDWWPVSEKDSVALSSCSPPLLLRSLLYQCHQYYHHSSPHQNLSEFINILLFINLYGFCQRQAQGTYLHPSDAIRKGKRQSW